MKETGHSAMVDGSPGTVGDQEGLPSQTTGVRKDFLGDAASKLSLEGYMGIFWKKGRMQGKGRTLQIYSKERD